MKITGSIKFLIVLGCISWSFPLRGQSLKLNSLKTFTNDTTLLIRLQCQAGPSAISKDDYPLIVINGTKFYRCLLQNIFVDFDTSSIEFLRVLNPHDRAVLKYGKAGVNGVILIRTKDPVEFISSVRS